MLEVICKKAKQKIYHHPILCLHGAQGGAWYFERYLDYFSKQGYDVYAMSLRGHGKSDGYENIDTYGLDDYVLDLIRVLESFNEKPILFAHSMGGAIAQKCLNQHQDKLHALFLLSSAPAGGIDPSSDLGLYYTDQMAFLRKVKKEKGKHVTFDMLMKETVFSPYFKDSEIDAIRRKLTKESDKVKDDLLKSFLKDDVIIKIPVFVFGSKADGILSIEDIYKTARRFNQEPIFVDKLSHFVTLDPYYMDLVIEVEKKLIELIRNDRK
jgi:pimeloyl-ACP methyl ester carboxylesterase